MPAVRSQTPRSHAMSAAWQAARASRSRTLGPDAAPSCGDTVGFDTVGFDAVGFDAVGFDAVGFDTVGFDTVGFDSVSCGTVGFGTVASLSSVFTSSGPGGVGAAMNAGSGSAGRPSSESKNLRGLGGAAGIGDEPVPAIPATIVTTSRPNDRRRYPAPRPIAGVLVKDSKNGTRESRQENGGSSVFGRTVVVKRYRQLKPSDRCSFWIRPQGCHGLLACPDCLNQILERSASKALKPC